MLTSREQEQLDRIEDKLNKLLNGDKVNLDIELEDEEDCGHEDCEPDYCMDDELYFPHW